MAASVTLYHPVFENVTRRVDPARVDAWVASGWLLQEPDPDYVDHADVFAVQTENGVTLRAILDDGTEITVPPIADDEGFAAFVSDPGSATWATLDATTATLAEDTSSATGASLSGTFAQPKGNTIVLAGDSRIAQEWQGTPADATFSTVHAGAFNYANIELGQRFQVLHNAGVNGNTIQQLIDRYQADVLSHQPQNVFLGIGINSISAGLDLPTVQGQLTQLFEMNRRAGAHTIIQTINPRNGNTAAQNTVLANTNRWLLSLNRRDVTVVDVTSPIVGEAGMVWRAGYTLGEDGLHQNRAAAVKMGRRIADTLRPLYPPRSPLPLYDGDPLNLMPNPFMTGTGATATGIGPFISTGTYAASLVPATDGLPGNWQQIVASDPALPTDVSLQKAMDLTANVAPGDTVECALELEFPDLSVLGVFNVTLQAMDASNAILKSTVGYTARSGDTAAWSLADFIGRKGPVVVKTPRMVVPANAAKLKLTLNCLDYVGTLRYRRIFMGKTV